MVPPAHRRTCETDYIDRMFVMPDVSLVAGNAKLRRTSIRLASFIGEMLGRPDHGLFRKIYQ
jgi:hypothetical protein